MAKESIPTRKKNQIKKVRLSLSGERRDYSWVTRWLVKEMIST